MPYSIYIIQNKINYKIYIGQAINFNARIKRHLRLVRGNKDQRHLYCAIRKYGWDNFESFVIENGIDASQVNEYEAFWIQYFRSWDRALGYNLTLGGEGCIPTAETREKMRQAKLGKPNPKMQGANHPMYGIKGEQHHRFGTRHTDEAKIKIAAANVGREFPKGSERYNSKITEEDVLYMREYFAKHTADKTKDIFAYLAQKFDIKKGTVESILYNYSWKHVKTFPRINKRKNVK